MPVRPVTLWFVGWAVLLIVSSPGSARLASAQDTSERDLIAVMELDVIGGEPTHGVALSNQLRSDVLKTGKVTLVDRARLATVLDEQALQQTTCTTQECAVQLGKLLGVRKIVTGSVTRIDAGLWQVAVQMIDVESAETVRAETYNHVGDFRSLLLSGMEHISVLLFPANPAAPESAPAAAPSAPIPPPRTQLDTANAEFGLQQGFGCLTVRNLSGYQFATEVTSKEVPGMIRLHRPPVCLRLAPGQYVVTLRYASASVTGTRTIKIEDGAEVVLVDR